MVSNRVTSLRKWQKEEDNRHKMNHKSKNTI